MIKTKYEAAQFFYPIHTSFKDDKDHAAYLPNGTAYLGRYAYIVSDIYCGRLAVMDNIPRCEIFWDYDEEISLELDDNIRSQIKSYRFPVREGRVLFLRKKDICDVIPKLTPLKKRKSILRLSVTEDAIEMKAMKQGLILKQSVIRKKIFSQKNTDSDEDFVGNIDVNLFYFEKMALENFDDCDIIGIRLLEKLNTMHIFVRGKICLDWMLRLQS